MGTEEAIYHASQTALQALGMDDEELCHILTLYLTQTGMSTYLTQGRCQGKRITTQFCSSSIGHILTLATDGEASEQSEEVADGR